MCLHNSKFYKFTFFVQNVMCIVSRELYVSAGPMPSGARWQAPAVAGPTCHPHTAPAPPSKDRPRAAASRRRSCRRCGAAAPRSRGAAHQPDQARHQHNLRPLQILHRGPVSFPARVLGRPRHRLKVELVAFRASHRDDSGCLWCFREEDWNAAFNYTFNLDFLQQCLVETRGKSANR